jgi:hypothetical protein
MARKIASIATNDPDNDPTPRVTLERRKIMGHVAWYDPDGNMVADGKTVAEAEAALRYVYNWRGWDLRFET